MQATGRVRFSFRFLFASYRDTDWNATRDFVLLGKNGIIAACVGDDCIKIDRFKKKDKSKPAFDDVISFQNAFKTDRKAFLDVFFARFARVYSEYDFARRDTRAEMKGIVRKRRFFVFRECNPRQHLEALWTRFFKKKKKRTLTPLPPLSLTQKILSMTHNNNRLSSEVTARSPRRN